MQVSPPPLINLNSADREIHTQTFHGSVLLDLQLIEEDALQTKPTKNNRAHRQSGEFGGGWVDADVHKVHFVSSNVGKTVWVRFICTNYSMDTAHILCNNWREITLLLLQSNKWYPHTVYLILLPGAREVFMVVIGRSVECDRISWNEIIWIRTNIIIVYSAHVDHVASTAQYFGLLARGLYRSRNILFMTFDLWPMLIDLSVRLVIKYCVFVSGKQLLKPFHYNVCWCWCWFFLLLKVST